jgi:uroporphyrinogen-III synthase
MPENNVSILCTRPLNDQIIQKAAARKISIDTLPFIETNTILSIETKAVLDNLSRKKIAAVFTSMNAVESVTRQLPCIPSWKIYCMAGITKDLAVQFFGQQALIITAKNAAALSDEIINEKEQEEIIFFCGDQHLPDLPEKLSQHHIPVQEIVVYTTIYTPSKIEKEYDGIVFFSPSAVHSYFSLNNSVEEQVFFSIGKSTTSAIQQYSKNRVITSDWPGKEQMADLVITYFSTLQHIQ